MTAALLLALVAAASSPGAQAATLALDSQPAGAVVRIDGAELDQRTPTTVEGLSEGPHLVELLGACSRAATTVTLTEGVASRVDLPLEAVEQRIVVQVEPADARVLLNGNPVTLGPGGTVPAPCGTHALAATAPRHLTSIATVEVDGSGPVRVALALKPLGTGTLTVRVQPENASIFVDGEIAGVGTLAPTPVVAGPHVVRAEATNHRPAERQFAVEDGREVSLELVLAPAPVASPTPAAVLPTRREKTFRRTGVGLTVVGSAALLLAGYEYIVLAPKYRTYLEHIDQDGLTQAEADDLYDETISGHRNTLFVAGASGVVLLGTGIGFLVAF